LKPNLKTKIFLNQNCQFQFQGFYYAHSLPQFTHTREMVTPLVNLFQAKVLRAQESCQSQNSEV
jgi:hypothetical protein